MSPLRNRVFPLTITTLTPTHIGTGTRLAANLDYYVDNETTFVVDTDVALDRVVQQWESNREPYDEILRRYTEGLAQDEERLQRRRQRNIADIQEFETAPPRDPAKRAQQEQRLRKEAEDIRALSTQIRQRRAAPPPPESNLLPDVLISGSTLDQLIAGGHLPIASLRDREDVDGRSLVRYVLQGRPIVAEMYEQIKDVSDRLYLPGSSLKGAIRSALAWDVAGHLAPQVLQSLSHGGEKSADNAIEGEIFLGRAGLDRQRMNNTVRDVLRTLHVADSTPVKVDPDLLAVQVFQSRSAGRIATEAIPAGVSFSAALQLERYPFEHADARAILDFGDWNQRLAPESIAAACRRRSADLIAGERRYFAQFAEAAEMSRFYANLDAQLSSLPSRACLIPLGWGAGWRSKTLDGRLRNGAAGEAAFSEAVRHHRLKKHKSANFRLGDSFPDTRKVALRADRPWSPLGWIHIEVGEERR